MKELLKKYKELILYVLFGGLTTLVSLASFRIFDSILGKDGKHYKKACKQILKNDLADIVASDAHNVTSRKSHMQQCRDHIAKEYGWDMAWKLFAQNPLRILSNDFEG